MKNKNFKEQVPKQLQSSRYAELVSKPGRLHTQPDEVQAFLHRARKGGSDIDPERMMAAAPLLQARKWAAVAHSALIALRRIFGIEGSTSAVRAVRKGKVKSSARATDVDLGQANQMLRALLEFLSTSTLDALTAHLVLTSSGELKAEEEPQVDMSRKKIPDERPTEIYAKPTFYTDNPLAPFRR
jgi:hypothetical protein